MNQLKSAEAHATRGPGRPAADGVDQRERLLDAAVLSFAEDGIAATSLRGLAHRQGVTPAMLNYYFGSRERLVDAVVEERLLPVMSKLKEQLGQSLERDSAVPLAISFVRALHATILANPWLPALWVREVLSEGGQLRTVMTERIAPEVARPLAERFAAGRSLGELNSGLEPRLLFVSLIGLTMLPFAAAPIWRRTFSATDIDPTVMLEHTLALLSQGIRP